jgi:hypothetical protein
MRQRLGNRRRHGGGHRLLLSVPSRDDGAAILGPGRPGAEDAVEVETEAGGERRHVPARGSGAIVAGCNGSGRRCRGEDQRRYLPPLVAPTAASYYLAVGFRCFVLLLLRPRGSAGREAAAAAVANVEEQEEEEGQEAAQQQRATTTTTTARCHLRSIFTGLSVDRHGLNSDHVCAARREVEKRKARNPLTGERRKQSWSRPGSDGMTEVESAGGKKAGCLKEEKGVVLCTMCWLGTEAECKKEIRRRDSNRVSIRTTPTQTQEGQTGKACSYCCCGHDLSAPCMHRHTHTEDAVDLHCIGGGRGE